MPTPRESALKGNKAAKDALRIALFTVLKRHLYDVGGRSVCIYVAASLTREGASHSRGPQLRSCWGGFMRGEECFSAPVRLQYDPAL